MLRYASLALSLTFVLGFCLESTAVAQGWRGDATGRYPDATPPTEWSREDKVVWKTPMPGRSYGSPVVIGERVFVVSDPAELLCVRASDGELLWQQSVTPEEVLGEEAAEAVKRRLEDLEQQKNLLRREFRDLRESQPEAKTEQEALSARMKQVDEQIEQLKRTQPVPNRGGSGNSAATPVTDGQTVYAAFGSGIVAAFDLAGEKKWSRFVEGATIGFGHSSSPVLLDGKLIVHFHDLVALDAATGETAWRVELPARHATAVAVRLGGTAAVVSPAGSVVRARDGQVVASDDGLRVAEGSPIVYEGLIFAQSGRTTAFRLVEDLDEPLEIVWEARSARGRRTPSSVIQDGLLYGVTTDGILEVFEVDTGDTVYRKRLDLDNIYSSVTAAGSFIFITSTKGETIVLQSGREYQEIARNQLEPLGSNPVFVGQRMYLRTHKNLYCIGK